MNKLISFSAKVAAFNKRLGDWSAQGPAFTAEREALFLEAKRDLGLPRRVVKPMLGRLTIDCVLPVQEAPEPIVEAYDQKLVALGQG